MLAEGIQVVEVERPRREDRRRGKSDEIDALAAAKKVLAGEGLSTPRAGGARQALSALLVVYRSCVAERTRLLNQLQGLHTSAPIALRDLPLHRQVAAAVGAERAEAVTLLMLAIDDILTSPQRAALNQLAHPIADHPALAGELRNVRAQLSALWLHAKVAS